MHKPAILATLLLLGTGAALAGSDGQDFAKIERGHYLTIAGDCAGCHDQPGGAAFAGGRKIETPFGPVTASNITPDRETGIGDWSDVEFVRALARGIRRDGAHLFPAMPYPYYTKVSHDDLLAIRAYLSTLQPVRHEAEGEGLPFPINKRVNMAAWNKLNFTPGELQSVAGKSAEWNRGTYLVEGLMHCDACHTPKGELGGDKTSEKLRGGVVQGWFAPDITNASPQGLGKWSAEDIVTYLKTGHNLSAAATGPMGEEVERSSSKMTDADLHAVAVYLKDQPGDDTPAPAPVAGSDPAVVRGKAIYADECSACHAPHGTGQPNLFPRLAGSPAVQSHDPTSLARVVLAGIRSVSTPQAPTAPAMPGFAWLLSDRDVADVLTFIRNSWGNAAPALSADQIQEQRKALTQRNG